MLVKFALLNRTLFLLLCFSVDILAQNITIPDTHFKAFCVLNYDGIDGSALDAEISQVEAAAVTGTMDCSNQDIANLTGVAYFTNLRELSCYSNQLTSLPVLNTLTYLRYLRCYSNQLTSLPDLATLTYLEGLRCYSNLLTSLPALTTLTNLDTLLCGSNQLTNLPNLTTLTNLRYLHCHDNQLTNLAPLTTLTQLISLSCSINQLTSLPDLSTLTSLRALYCSSNQLTSLPDLTMLTNLQTLYCTYNQITSLPDLITQTHLQDLQCHFNQLTSLPSLTTLISLRFLSCSANQLTSLPDLTGLDLDYLYFQENNLDYGDCPDIATIEALNLSEFVYNPLRDGSTLDCSCQPVVINTHPNNSSVCPDDSVTFTVTATGTEPLTYQWCKDGDTIMGATSTSYTIDPVSSDDAGSYDCEISNACGNGTSNTAILNIALLPTQSDAGPDKTSCTFQTTLEANTPVAGQGEWSILDGENVIVSNQNDPHSPFSGAPGDFLLQWSISTACGTSSDSVVITIPAVTLDIFTVNNGPDETFFNDGTGDFSLDNTYGSQFSTSIDLGDIDGDGYVDAFITGNSGVLHRLWINDGFGVFSQSTQDFGGGTSQTSLATCMVDLDGDRNLDVFLTRMNSSPTADQLYFNDGSGNFTLGPQELGTGSTYSIALGDIDDDGDTDLITGGVVFIYIWLNDGTGTFTEGGTLNYGITYALACGDIDQDGDLDLFTGQNGVNKIWFNDGSGVFSDSGQSLGASYTYDATLADLNHDGSLDLICANFLGQANTVWLNNGNGVFAISQSIGDSSSMTVDLGDVDQDGDLDALFGNNGPNKLYLNNGSGGFTDSMESIGSGMETRAMFGALRGDSGLITIPELYREVTWWNVTLTVLDFISSVNNLCRD